MSDWQFWIDVGGTFTDCIARVPNGSLVRHKVLSSAVTKGSVAPSSTTGRILDPLRSQDPAQFWRGYRLTLFAGEGQPICTTTVTSFDPHSGALEFDQPLAFDPVVGQSYELSSNEDAPLLAIRYLMKLALDDPVPPITVRLGTTRGTNALITRRGARTALVTTRGLGDILHIGYQNRPRLFDLVVSKPASIIESVLEVDERISVAGEVLVEPDWRIVRDELTVLYESGIESLAICLLHAFKNPGHEQQIERIAREIGFDEISCSSVVSPLIKIVARGDTTSVDAYLNPVLRGYVRKLREGLGHGTDLQMLTSAGGLVDADRFLGKDSILSGPAGGVVGFSKIATAAGYSRAIGFDMGGTSTDVTRFDGHYELQYETEKAGVRVVSPMMAIETVAAGGGSICKFDGVKLTVGPDSAGADPGPACYGCGGPLTVTDLNFFTGKILVEKFPFTLDREAVVRRLTEMRDEVTKATGRDWDLADLAIGFLQVANANMAKAIRSISVTRGYDPREYLLVSFGGAAAQHACAIADELGMNRILNHPDAGILSAYGIGMADIVRHQVAGLYETWSKISYGRACRALDQLTVAVVDEIQREGVSRDRIEVVPSLDLRYQGVDACLTIKRPSDGDYQRAFAEQHQQRYGYTHRDRTLEIVAVRVQGTGRSKVEPAAPQRVAGGYAHPERSAKVQFHSGSLPAGVFDRESLQPGDRIAGPAIITEQVSTTIVDPGWKAEVLSSGELLIEREEHAVVEVPGAARYEQPDPIDLELFNNQFAGIAEKMGITLRNTSSSVNVKERLDFSCALFTPDGGLVVNAPHIPVHLGAMSETVKCLIEDNRVIHPGDVFVTNDPFRGGSHLPDITVITPVFERRTGIGPGPGSSTGAPVPNLAHQSDTSKANEPRLLFFTASRAHHAEIGGVAPGSMPPFSRCLAEEGVLIRNFKLIDKGESRHDALRDVLLSGEYPTRSVDENMADIEAQVAANRQGSQELLRLIDRKGADMVQAYMRHIQNAAEKKMRLAIARLPDGRHDFVDHLDNGAAIQVEVSIHGDEAVIDFAGTAPVQPGNLNANRAIVAAAVMYVFRCLIDEDIPLNQGVLAPIRIELPECLLNPPPFDDPRKCAAVAGGNVETSQRVVDVLLGALEVAAASQGTMNNLLFGDDSFGYYETICGGSGATALADGASAVHTHMTNTRLTDPEVLELRYPIRVREFSIRRDSGGSGKHVGGDGVVRRLEFLKPLQVSLLSQRRGQYLPYGLAGGQSGCAGKNSLQRRDGSVEPLDASAHFQVEPGDILTIETPGGGGFGT